MARGKSYYNKKKMKKQINEVVEAQLNKHIETKRLLVTSGGASVAPINTIPTTLNPLHQIGNGTGANDRIGQAINPSSLSIRFSIDRGNTDGILRMIFFRFKEAGFIRSGHAVLDLTNDTTPNVVNNTYVLDKANRKRFEVLDDRCFVLDDGKQNTVKGEYSVKMTKRILYDGTSSLSDQYNGIYFMMVSNCSSTANAPKVNYNILLRYQDA